MATLYVVATPIGNLEDMTLRAIRTLKEVHTILCEDTRTTKTLLVKYGIETPTLSYHAQSAHSKAERILNLLEEGHDLALVSDAGTPTISDPGVLLVSQVKERFHNTVAVVPIPGASAVIAALSASGLPSSDFLFLGFLPHKKGRETLFKEIAESRRTVAFYESPHRILKTLASFAKLLPERRIMLARELTKLHEEFLDGTAAALEAHFEAHPDTLRGEFVVLVEPR